MTAVVNIVMNLRVFINSEEIFWLAEELLAFQEGLCCLRELMKTLLINKWVCGQKHNYIRLIRCYVLRSKNYMFRPEVAIIRFYHSTHLRLFYTVRVTAYLMRRSQHQRPCWSIVPLYWACG